MGSLGAVWMNFWVVGMLSRFGIMKCPDFGTDFQLEKEGIWSSVLHRNFIYNCELDVRLFNDPNWTSRTRVMVHFSRLPQAALF